ncbi:MAG: YybH family protein [Gemmataceae bacterium]
MKQATRLILVVLSVLVLFWVAYEVGKTRAGNQVERTKDSVRSVLAKQQAAWNEGNLEEFMEGYWHSEDLTFYSGNDIQRGWQATTDRYRKRYQSEGREMGKLAFDDLEVDVLDTDNALVRGRWKLAVTDGSNPQGLFTLRFRRLPEGWRIVHDHTSMKAG